MPNATSTGLEMHRIWFVLPLVLGLAFGKPAVACMADEPIVLNDVAYADVVVVGRISDYRVVGGEPGRRGIWAYALFTIEVDQVVVGEAGNRITVTWDNSTFSEPEEMPSGPFLIALRGSTSRAPPLRGTSATILPNPNSQLLTVLQAPCSEPFIFSSTSDEAQRVRQILATES